MKKLFLLTLVLFLVAQISYAASGIFDAYLIYTLNGSGNTYIQAPNVNTLVLNNPTSFILKGGQIKTYKNNGSNVTGGGLQYRIYKQGDTAPGYSYSGGFSWTADLGNGDQSWEKNNDNVNLLNGLTSGTYTLEIYFEAYTSTDGNQYFNNGGANYKATIILYNKSITNGNWNSAGTWSEGIPTQTQLVMIESGHNVTLNTDATIANLTINTGGTFTASDASSRLLTISKSTSGSSTTLANSGTWSNGTGGSSVIFSGSPNSGDATHIVSGTIGFQNIKITKSSGSSNVGASFSSGSTVSGTLEIGAGGYVSTAPPVGFYNSTAILKFNQGSGAIYDVNAADNSWSTDQIPQNITISSGTINLNANRTATGNLLIDGGALVLNSNSPNLTINGNWTRSSGSFTANTGTVTLSGATDGIVNVTGGASMNNLVIAKSTGYSATLDCSLSAAVLTINSNAKLNVNAGKQLSISTTFTNNGELSLLSSAVGTATILTPEAIAGTGSYKVQQHLTSARNWYMTAPTNTNTPSGYTFYQYLEPGNNTGFVAPASEYWKNINQGTAMESMIGYIVQASGSSTIEFTGTSLNNGAISKSDLSRTTNASKLGFNLVGNPYPSFLNWTDATKSNLNQTMWYRTKEGAVYKFYTYSAQTNLGSPIAATRYIPPMQAFWVRVENGTGTLSLTNSMRSHSAVENLLKAPASKNTNQKVLRIEISNGTNTDETVLLFNSGASDNFDAYDSPKMPNELETVPEIFTVVGNENVVINGLNNVSLGTEIPLGFTTKESNTFEINTSEFSNFDVDTKVILKDKLVNTEQEITNGRTYSFWSDVATTVERFSVIFKSSSVATDLNNTVDSDKIIVFANESKKITINLNSDLSKSYSLEVYNSYGQRVTQVETKNSTETINKNLDSGVYFVKININEKISTHKVIIR